MGKLSKINAKKKFNRKTKKSKKKLGGSAESCYFNPKNNNNYNENNKVKKEISGKVKESYNRKKNIYTYSYNDTVNDNDNHTGKDNRAIIGWNTKLDYLINLRRMYNTLDRFNNRDFNRFFGGTIEIMKETFLKSDLIEIIERELNNRIKELSKIEDFEEPIKKNFRK